MTVKTQHCILVFLFAQLVSVLALDCFDSTGITYVGCGSLGKGKGGGGGNEMSYKMVEKCEDEIFEGAGRKGYQYSKQEFGIIITDINLSGSETLVVKSFTCNPESACKVAVIDADAALPIYLFMNRAQFIFQSASTTLNVTWHVDDECDDCGGIFTDSEGDIRSPNFPFDYPHYLECVYVIQPSPAGQVSITFPFFDIETDYLGDCIWDYVEIRDGVDGSAPPLGMWCHTSTPPDIVSSGNGLWIKFKTDFSVTNNGFYATYTTV